MTTNKKLTNHFINGDKETNFFQNIFYSLFFIIEILNDKKFTQNPELFGSTENIQNYLQSNKNLYSKSPSRILCELFLLNYLEKNFNKREKIRILDIGCGNGVSIKFFKSYFKNFEYFGCDYKKRLIWQEIKDKNISFFEYEIGKNFEKNLGEIDLIYSQSVLEHVKYDLSGLEILNQKFNKAKNLHFIPAPLSFLNYQKHGYRRYSFNALKKLSSKISKEMNIFSIGGKNAFLSHFNYNDTLEDNKLIFSKYFKKNLQFKNQLNYLEYLINDVKRFFPSFYVINY